MTHYDFEALLPLVIIRTSPSSFLSSAEQIISQILVKKVKVNFGEATYLMVFYMHISYAFGDYTKRTLILGISNTFRYTNMTESSQVKGAKSAVVQQNE